MTDREALPCPFCGSLPKLTDRTQEKEGAWVLQHQNPGCIVRIENGYRTKEDALKSWNKRAPVKDQP